MKNFSRSHYAIDLLLRVARVTIFLVVVSVPFVLEDFLTRGIVIIVGILAITVIAILIKRFGVTERRL